MMTAQLFRRAVVLVTAIVAVTAASVSPVSAQVPAPDQFFGFRIGTDGELARYPKALEYFQLLSKQTDRVKYEELGKTTLGNPYVLLTISSPQNLRRLDRLVEISQRLADPRRTSEAEAAKLAEEGRPFFFLYATIHSNEIGNGQSVIEIAHRLATETSQEVQEILNNAVVLIVPSQNPDGQYLLIDHWYDTKGTQLARNYPDLYHVYAGHDDNRDWFMFTQKETRLNVEKVQNVYKPVVTHDMHQQGAGSSRIWVPPFDEPYDPNIHPLIARQHAELGSAMATALPSEGKTGVEWGTRYDMWTAARQYMLYHGGVRILTEIASANFADPYPGPGGRGGPIGSQTSRVNFPVPFTGTTWTLRNIIDYGNTTVYAGLTHVAKNRRQWLSNFYKIHNDFVNWSGSPYAFVVPADQRDPYSTYRLIDILRTGAVEVHQASAPFTAGGQNYAAGSYVVKVAQPYGGFAKTLLEKQVYPDLRLYPGGPPKAPYDVTTQTLGLLMGVDVRPVEQPFDTPLQLVTSHQPIQTPVPASANWAYVFGPESNAGFIAAARLQKARIPIFRTSSAVTNGGRTWAPGTWIVPPTADARQVLVDVARDTGLVVAAADTAFETAGHRLRPETRIGLWKGVNNASGGWLKWLFEHYAFNHDIVKAGDLSGNISDRFDAIVLPDGVSRNTIVNGLNTERYGPEWAWAAGVGDAGWNRLRDWVENGGTLVAIGSSVTTARELFDLPLENALPTGAARGGGAAFGGGGRQGGAGAAGGGRGRGAGPGAAGGGAPQAPDTNAVLREAFSSPANLASALNERVIDSRNLFYSPGALLQNEFDTSHPVAYGLPSAWPIFFENNQALRLVPSFTHRGEVVARYPGQGPILQSGWLLGEPYLRNQANAVAFRVGKGYVVTFASEVTFRAQPEATFKLVFNSIFHGPSTAVGAADLASLATGGATR